MRKANVKMSQSLLEKRLAEARMSELERNRALTLMRDAEAVADAIIWVKEKVASFSAPFAKPSFKN